jgi:hypothetical protein
LNIYRERIKYKGKISNSTIAGEEEGGEKKKKRKEIPCNLSHLH